MYSYSVTYLFIFIVILILSAILFVCLKANKKKDDSVNNVDVNTLNDIANQSNLKCPKCGTVNPEGSMFCQECGTKLDVV